MNEEEWKEFWKWLCDEAYYLDNNIKYIDIFGRFKLL